MSSPVVYSPTSLSNALLFLSISPLPPARPNTAPHCNKLVHHILFPHIVTPLNYNAWAHFLTDYPDKEFVLLLLQIIKFGINIRFLGDQAACPSKNIKSALQSPSFIEPSIDKLLACNHAHGPFISPPFN
jgi:hypothetical protein